MGRRWPEEETAKSLRKGLKKWSEGGVVESETCDRHLMVPELFRGPTVEGRRKMGALRHFSASAVAREGSE